MKICFVALSFGRAGEPASGVGAQLRLLAETLIASGHSVQVITLGTRTCVRVEEGIETHEVTAGHIHWYVSRLPFIGRLLALPVRELEYGLAAFKGVRQAEKTGAADIIEGTETGMVILALLRSEAPIVIRLHGEQYTFHRHTPDLKMTIGVRLARWLQRFALRRARVLISPSHAHAAEIARELVTECPVTHIVPNCVRVASLPARKEDLNRKIVLFAGRLDRVKGVTVFLQAAGQVIQQVPDAQFVIAGSSHPALPQTEIDCIISRHSLEKHVRMLGHVPSRELQTLYQQASVVVVPSYYESFGLVALEAMANGTAVVATRVGGLVEMVEDGVSAVLVAAGDVGQTAEATVRILKDEGARKRMGNAARVRAEALFATERIKALNLDAYAQIQSNWNTRQRETPVAAMVRGKAA